MTRQASPAETVVSVEHLTRPLRVAARGDRRQLRGRRRRGVRLPRPERRREVDHDPAAARAVSADVGPHAGVRASTPARQRRRSTAAVGYLPGELALYPRLTGRQHLDRFADIRGLRDARYRDELVDRFGAELDRPVRALSKGNRQKIGLVLAFMHRPRAARPRRTDLRSGPAAAGRVRAPGPRDRRRRAAPCSCPRTNSTRCSVSSTGSRSSRTAASSSPTPSRACAAPRRAPSSSGSPRDVDPGAFAALDGVRVLHCADGRVVLSITGPVAPLLRVAADLDPLDITARPADLDELFLTYYRTAPEPEVDRCRLTSRCSTCGCAAVP